MQYVARCCRLICGGILLICVGCERPHEDAKSPQELVPARAVAPDVVGGRIRHQGILRDVRGANRPLETLVGERGLVLAFLGIECPLANQVMPRLMELEKKYRRLGIQFIGVYSHEHETIDEMAAHAADHDVPFPVVKDANQSLADALKVTRTPEFCLLDAQGVLRYRGRISDQFGLGFQTAQGQRECLSDSLDALLAGQPVPEPVTSVDGCLLDRRSSLGERKDVTYVGQVAGILRQHCQECHREGQAAPFSLMTYDDAVRWSEMVAEVVSERRMPPWHADARFGKFHNARRLSRDEMDAIVSWVKAGTPRGEGSEPPADERWNQPWAYGEPDVVLELPADEPVPAEGAQIIRQVYIPAAITEELFAEDRWLVRGEVRPGATAVVHHVLVHFVAPGDLPPPESRTNAPAMVGWAPGEPAYVFPEGSALRIPKGSRVVFELHYAPNGTAALDRSMVGLTFAKEPPAHPLIMLSPSRKNLVVPAGSPHYRDEINWTFNNDVRLLGLMGHMHLRGKSYKIEALFPDRTRETLLSVPRYDFNWQTFYWFEEPRELPAGTQLFVTSHWDNSRMNPNNPDPTVPARSGWMSENEMQSCWTVYEDLIGDGTAPSTDAPPEAGSL
jgi:mono/diheme cytochrome c family protein